MKRWVVTVGLSAAIAAGQVPAQAERESESFDIVTSTADGDATRWRIDRPNVRAPATRYSQIALRAGDRVTLQAGGCVQVGGHGKTWKRYVDPLGDEADTQYSALVDILGRRSGSSACSCGFSGR